MPDKDRVFVDPRTGHVVIECRSSKAQGPFRQPGEKLKISADELPPLSLHDLMVKWPELPPLTLVLMKEFSQLFWCQEFKLSGTRIWRIVIVPWHPLTTRELQASSVRVIYEEVMRRGLKIGTLPRLWRLLLQLAYPVRR